MTNIQSSGTTLLDTMNQLLVFTEMTGKKNPSHGAYGIATTVVDDVTGNQSQINLGTLVEEVVDGISLGHTFKAAHGRDLAMQRKGLDSIRSLHNSLTPIVTAVTIHPEAAKLVKTQVGALRRLLMILYSNALNYTSHGHVEVESSLLNEPGQVTGRAFQLVVRDSGRGPAFPDKTASGGTEEKASNADEHTTNCLLVDDNEVNLKVRLSAA